MILCAFDDVMRPDLMLLFKNYTSIGFKKVQAPKAVLEEWTGMELEPSSMYGIRQYTKGAILSPHADRNPLITSCIINVAQDLEEDWPLEVYGRDGLAYNVTMKSGDMVLYESHSLIHGRPFPMKGKYFANIFVSVNLLP